MQGALTLNHQHHKWIGYYVFSQSLGAEHSAQYAVAAFGDYDNSALLAQLLSF